MGRLNRPALMVYGGTIRAGCTRRLRKARHRLRLPKLRPIPRRQDHRSGSATRSSATPAPARAPAAACTPPTPWPAAIEALGMTLPYSSSTPAEDPAQARGMPRRRRSHPHACSRHDLKPRDIMTREAFENAMAVVIAARRLDQRRAAPHRHGPRRRRRLDHRRLPEGQRPRAVPRRPQAQRQVRHGRPARRRRHPRP